MTSTADNHMACHTHPTQVLLPAESIDSCLLFLAIMRNVMLFTKPEYTAYHNLIKGLSHGHR